MTEKEKMAIEAIVACLRARAPIDTANLANNGIGIGQEDGRYFAWVGGEAADYAVYTNEPWTSENWHGAQNPNEGWIEAALKDARPLIEQIFSGGITQEEYIEFMQNRADEFALRDKALRGDRIMKEREAMKR